MSYTKPTLSELIDAVSADMFSRFDDLDPALVSSFAQSVAEVIAGTNYGLYGYLDFILKQPFPDTAEEEFAERWGSILDISRNSASKASGNATFTGTIGSSTDDGDLLTSSDGTQYEIVTGFSMTSTSEDHEVQAVESGDDGNIDASAELTFVSVPSGIDETATVDDDGLTGGADIEDDDSYVERILEQFASPPKGGKSDDYIQWAKDATTATRAFIFDYTDAGLETVEKGEVLIYFAMDDDYDDGIPSSGDVETVQEYIDEVRPLGSRPTVIAPTALTVDFDVSITPDSTTTEAAVETELQNMIEEKGGVGTSITLYNIYEAMSLVPDLTDWTLNSPTASTTTAAGELHTLGTITYS